MIRTTLDNVHSIVTTLYLIGTFINTTAYPNVYEYTMLATIVYSMVDLASLPKYYYIAYHVVSSVLAGLVMLDIMEEYLMILYLHVVTMSAVCIIPFELMPNSHTIKLLLFLTYVPTTLLVMPALFIAILYSINSAYICVGLTLIFAAFYCIGLFNSYNLYKLAQNKDGATEWECEFNAVIFTLDQRWFPVFTDFLHIYAAWYATIFAINVFVEDLHGLIYVTATVILICLIGSCAYYINLNMPYAKFTEHVDISLIHVRIIYIGMYGYYIADDLYSPANILNVATGILFISHPTFMTSDYKLISYVIHSALSAYPMLHYFHYWQAHLAYLIGLIIWKINIPRGLINSLGCLHLSALAGDALILWLTHDHFG